MMNRHTIALAIGTIITFSVFFAAIGLLVFGEYFSERDKLIYLSIALGPVAMMSVMLGYAVWWLALFLMSLILPGSASPDGADEAE
jgi:hypothetical protein